MIQHNGEITLDQISYYWAHTRGDFPAVVSNGISISWKELNRISDSVATNYQKLGVKPGDRIGCLLPNCAEYYALVIGAWKCGAVFVPLNIRFGDFELKAICEDASFQVIISTPTGRRRINATDTKIESTDYSNDDIWLYNTSLSIHLSDILTSDKRYISTSVGSESAGLIVYTSGTTGVPKGVCFSQKKLLRYAFSISLSANITSEDKFLLLAPLAFGGGILCNLLLAYVFGSTLYLENDFDPQQALNLISQESITVLTGVPILWQSISQQPSFNDTNLSSLRWAVSGGAPMQLDLLQRYYDRGITLQQSYGCTEIGGFGTLLPSYLALKKPGCCGIPVLGVGLRIANDSGMEQNLGTVGEIILSGTQLFDGYYNMPNLTTEAVINGWYSTGDLGYLDQDGHLYITDRKKNMIISGGVNVYPAEVERALLTLPEVTNVVVLGTPSARWGEAVVAIISINDDIDSNTLRQKALPLLGDFKTPKFFYITSQPFPLTASGKVARGEKLQDFLRQLI